MTAASGTAPLDDPAYIPQHQPDRGTVPDVIARWGPRSQLRWFRRFGGQLRPQPAAYWDPFYCSSEDHRGDCCVSCIADQEEGYGSVDGACCCRGIPGEAP
jgi:hypothetical protein